MALETLSNHQQDTGHTTTRIDDGELLGSGKRGERRYAAKIVGEEAEPVQARSRDTPEGSSLPSILASLLGWHPTHQVS